METRLPLRYDEKKAITFFLNARRIYVSPQMGGRIPISGDLFIVTAEKGNNKFFGKKCKYTDFLHREKKLKLTSGLQWNNLTKKVCN